MQPSASCLVQSTVCLLPHQLQPPPPPQQPQQQQPQQRQQLIPRLRQINRVHDEQPPQPQQPPLQQQLQLQVSLTVHIDGHQSHGVPKWRLDPPAGVCLAACIDPAALVVPYSHAAAANHHQHQRYHHHHHHQLQHQKNHLQQAQPQPQPQPQSQRLHSQLTLRPLGCPLLASPLSTVAVAAESAATAAAGSALYHHHLQPCHHLPPALPQQWQPLPLAPPQQQQSQQRRPCIPFFAPTTPPLDADAPGECILLLCKALCMSEGTTGRLALHIWNRIRGMVRLLVSVRPQVHAHRHAAAPAAAAAAAADRIYAVAAVWLAAKLEETRRELPTVHILATAARTLPSVLVGAELRVLQWCEWAPYLGFVPDDSYLLIDM